MNKTKIEWADYSWNVITGCLRGCEYCYARRIAQRFQGCYDPHSGENVKQDESGIISLKHVGRLFYKTKKGEISVAPYPYGFAPTFHSYRLDEPSKLKKPANIFVVSMGDLFGEWVPDEWIKAVFDACAAAPWHNYLFLTKNPKRYADFARYMPSNMWFGATYTDPTSYKAFITHHSWNTFVSIEPLLADVGNAKIRADWAIIGAMSGAKASKHQPKAEWIRHIVDNCRAAGIPVFMKDSLLPIMGEENMLREFPAGLKIRKRGLII